ncbi:hypothetical protein PM082_007191 [Marasmius tenuissimus]|nr:hypothetical protein PM082_007191 [Marasmius tenuissimus]
MTAEQIDRGLNIVRTGSNPWKFWDVLVWKGQHRGFHHVMDVIPFKKTKSRLMIQVQTNTVNAVGSLINIDYDHVVDSQLLLPLHILQQPSLAPQPPADYQHPGIAGLSKQQSQLHLRNAAATPSQVTTPTPAVMPPLDPSLADPAAPEADAWNPNAAPVSNDTTDVSSPPVLAPSSLVNERWKSTHISHHEFYELERSIADKVLFQVKLDGRMPAFKDRKYMYSHISNTWFSIYFLRDSTMHVLAMDWQRIKGRLPREMVIYPQRPTQKTNLPLMVTRGEFKDSVVTKVAGVGTDLHVLPLVASTGDVDTNASTFKVSCSDCCII